MDSRIEIRPGRFIHLVTHHHASSDTTIFLIHGLGGRGNQWRDQINFLKRHYTLVVPDLLGHGKSDAPTPVRDINPYAFPELDLDMHAIFNRYSSANNIIVGHSYGGALASSLTLDHQDKIRQLALIAPLPCTANANIPFMYQLPVFMMEVFRPLMERNFQRLAFASNADPRLIATELKAGKSNQMYVIKAMVNGMKAIPSIDLSMLHTPTLMLSGEQDGVVSVEAQKNFYRGLPHHQFQDISNASHMVLLEQAQQINQFIGNFLKQHNAAS